MFTSGFTMHPQTVAESMEGPTILWMQNWAKQINAALGGSLVIKEGTLFYNRFVIATPSGALHFYDKRHTFTLAGEDKVYKKGTHNGLLNKKAGPFVCVFAMIYAFLFGREIRTITIYFYM
jgi:omega-amidase